MAERRLESRAPVEFFVNEYIDGFPHLCHALDISRGGLRVSRVLPPDTRREFYSIEMGVPGERHPIWVWTRPVWTVGREQALRFVGLDQRDELALDRYLATLAA